MLYDPKWEVPAPIAPVYEPWQDVLFEAAKIIKKSGWVQGAFENANGHCVMGAIDKATKHYADRIDDGLLVYADARHHLSVALDGNSPMKWNDERGTTREMVLEKLLLASGRSLDMLDVAPSAPIVVDSSSWTGR